MFILLVIAVAAVPVLFYSFWAGKDWWFLDPINTFWPVYILFGVFQPLAFREGWMEIYGEGTVLITLGMFVLAGGCVCAGYRLDLGRWLGLRLPVQRGQDNVGRLIILGFVAIACGVAAYASVIKIAGGIASFLSTSRTNIDYSQTSNSLLSVLSLVPLGLFILLCTCYAANSHQVLKRVALVGTLSWGLWCVYSGTRSGVISTAVILFGSIYGRKRNNPSVGISVLALAAVVVLVGFTTQYRGIFYGGHFNSGDSVTEAIDASLTSFTESKGGSVPMGAEFSMAEAVIQNVPSQVPYDFGHMLLEMLTRPIPRSFWPDKLYPEGEAWDRIHRVAGTAGWQNNAGYLSGPAPGLVGKYYYIGGVEGVILGGLWTGVFLNAVRTYTRRYPPVAQSLIAVGCFILGFSEMNNPLSLEFGWLPSTGVGLALIILLSRKRQRAVSGPSRLFILSAPREHPAPQVLE